VFVEELRLSKSTACQGSPAHCDWVMGG